MRRGLYVSLALFGLFLLQGIGEAATVKGRILDSKTKAPITDVACEASIYRWNGHNWDYVKPAYPNGNGYFLADGLPAGKYYFEFYSSNHYGKFYQNTALLNQRTEVDLLDSTVMGLGTTYLTPLKIRVNQASITEPTADKAVISCYVVNDYTTPQTVIVWPSLQIDRDLTSPNARTIAYGIFSLAPKTVTVPAQSKLKVTFTANLPAKRFSAGVSIFCGRDRYNPITYQVWAGRISAAP